jgi:acyl carrier protein
MARKSRVFPIIRGIIAMANGLDEEDVLLESKLRDDLGLDSIDIAELAVKVEKEFGINIKDETINDFATVENVVDYVVKVVW